MLVSQYGKCRGQYIPALTSHSVNKSIMFRNSGMEVFENVRCPPLEYLYLATKEIVVLGSLFRNVDLSELAWLTKRFTVFSFKQYGSGLDWSHDVFHQSVEDVQGRRAIRLLAKQEIIRIVSESV